MKILEFNRFHEGLMLSGRLTIMLLEFLYLCDSQDVFLLYSLPEIEAHFMALWGGSIKILSLLTFPVLLFITLSSHIFPRLAKVSDLRFCQCFKCAYSTLCFMTPLPSLIIHLRCYLLWETLSDTSRLCFMIFLVCLQHPLCFSLIKFVTGSYNYLVMSWVF